MRRPHLVATLLIASYSIPSGLAAQSDPRAPTEPSNPLKLLIDKLNDPKRGAALRSDWKIDRAVWVEPVTALKNGVNVLLTPAHADIHTSIDSAGAAWSPDGPLISASHNPTGARVLIPRGYEKQAAPTRMVSFAPGGGAKETYSFELGYAVLSPVLRRGYVLSVISAWSTVAPPIRLADWGPHLNTVAVHVERMLVGLGLPSVSYDYAWGESRGARFLAYASELTGTPFAGVIEERGGGDIVDSALEQIRLLNDIRAANPTDDAGIADYISKIGRKMKITTRNGISHEEYIPTALTDDERFFFKLPATANILMPVIPPYRDDPRTANDARFRVPAATGNRSAGGNPFDAVLAWSTGPLNTRRVLDEVDPSYANSVDDGTALLRNWDPKSRRPEVRAAIRRLIPTGRIKTKVLKVHGTLDPNIYPLTAINYVQKIVDQGLADRYRWYLVPGMGHLPATREETFVDDNGKTVSLGVQLTHLDLLIGWVERGVDPGDFISIDPNDATKTLSVKGAHQLGFQKSPLKYFWAAVGNSALPSLGQTQH